MPRAGLTRQRVIQAAADFVDEVGLDGLTLALLADRFGVAVPSLYKHVEGLEAVRRGVAALAVRALGSALESALEAVPSSQPTARLRALARSYRAFALQHPGQYEATIRAASPDDPDLVAASDAVLRLVSGVLAERAPTGDDAIDAVRILRSALHGFVSLEAAHGFGLPRDVDRSFERLVTILDRGLTPGG